jgi:MFS transporter, ACS family, hexuronate transporter
MGLFNSGSTLAAVIAPPLIVFLARWFGWRSAFILLGFMGFIWLAFWLKYYRAGEPHMELVKEARKFIHRVNTVSFGSLVRRREVWAITLCRFLADPVWWFYITWLPLYLARVRHLSLLEIGYYAWVPFLAADVGSLLGGSLSGYLIGSGWTVNFSRKTVILVGTCIASCGFLVARTSSTAVALALISAVLFGFQMLIINVHTLPSDYFPKEAAGAVMGMGGVGAGVGAVLFTALTGYVVDHFSYTPLFFIAGILPIAATVSLFVLGGSVKRLNLEPIAQGGL